jgi:hypothetical protein
MTQKGVPTDSRAQVVNAFRQLLDERKAAGSKIATKQDEAERRKDGQAVELASAYTVERIVKGLADFQLNFGDTVDGLTKRILAESSKLGEIQRAIEVEDERVAELRAIRIAADALDILSREHQEKTSAFEARTREEREALEAEIAKRRDAWQKEREEFERAEREYAEALKRERQQSEADFTYELERQRKIDADEYGERRRTLEREIAERQKENDRDWLERERVLGERQALTEEYAAKVEATSGELEAAVAKAREEAMRDAAEAEEVKASLFEREVAANEKVYELRIQSLQAGTEQKAARIADLSTQLQTALQQVQNLAMRAVQGANKAHASGGAAPEPRS